MAGDLIPPPSPAGRPEQPGGGSTETPRPRQWLSGGETALQAEQRAERDEREQEPPRPEPRLAPDSPYRPRFGFLFGALIGVAIAAAGLAYLLVTGGGSGAPDGWSSWRPDSDERLTAAAQIAEHVAPKYRHQSGEQFVFVRASDLEFRDIPLEVVVRNPPPAGIQRIDGDGVMYTLAGFGPMGAIEERGKTTEAHQRLLRREALELALYTFRYAKGVDLVVALLPPEQAPPARSQTPTANPFRALLFEPGDLEAQVDAPSVEVTVPEARTPRPAGVGAEAPRIDALTRPNLFLATIRQLQDARLYLVLDPPQSP